MVRFETTKKFQGDNFYMVSKEVCKVRIFECAVLTTENSLEKQRDSDSDSDSINIPIFSFFWKILGGNNVSGEGALLAP